MHIKLQYWQLDLEKMKKIRKLLPKLLISQTLKFNISATECPIEKKNKQTNKQTKTALDSEDQGLQHIPLLRKSKSFT